MFCVCVVKMFKFFEFYKWLFLRFNYFRLFIWGRFWSCLIVLLFRINVCRFIYSSIFCGMSRSLAECRLILVMFDVIIMLFIFCVKIYVFLCFWGVCFLWICLNLLKILMKMLFTFCVVDSVFANANRFSRVVFVIIFVFWKMCVISMSDVLCVWCLIFVKEILKWFMLERLCLILSYFFSVLARNKSRSTEVVSICKCFRVILCVLLNDLWIFVYCIWYYNFFFVCLLFVFVCLFFDILISFSTRKLDTVRKMYEWYYCFW